MVLAGKVTLAVVTCLLLASAGGGILLVPVLAPLHLLAARGSARTGRVLWSLPVGLGSGATAWAGVYTILGERQPVIWAVPLLVGAAVTGLFWWLASP